MRLALRFRLEMVFFVLLQFHPPLVFTFSRASLLSPRIVALYPHPPPLQQCEALYKELIAGDDSSASDLESSDMKSGLDELQQLYADKAKDLEARTEELQSGAQVSGC